MNASQTNTQAGAIVRAAVEDLSDKEGHLVLLTDDSGTPVVTLPAAQSDITPYVLVDGDIEGEDVAIQPLSGDRNVRVRLKSTCVAGDILVLADIGTAADIGKVRKIPTTAGTYRALLIAEESGVDGQLVLARPCSLGNLTVT